MKSANTGNITGDQASFSQLTPLGWAPFFQQQLDPGSEHQSPARVIGMRRNSCLVKQGQQEIQATMAGRLFHGPGTNLPAVGDWVLLQQSVITSVLERKNSLSRMAPGGRNAKNSEPHLTEQVLAANLDKVFIVCGLDRDFNLRRIERYLTMVYNCGIDPVVILTKADLHPDPDDCVREVESIAMGVPVYPVSARDDHSVLQPASLVPPGSTAALIGSSGAGKSTLINRLYGQEIRATGSVGDRVGKGKHTTTTRDLIMLPTGGMVIDNPGIREIALSLNSEQKESAFPEIEALARSCKFKDCSHTHEPGCRVLEAVSSGKIPGKRLKNYQKIKNELNYQVLRETKSASRTEKERWKGVSQKIKSLKKRR